MVAHLVSQPILQQEGVSLEYLGAYTASPGNTLTFTYNGVDCGNKAGFLLIGFTGRCSNSTSTPASATVNGNAMTLELQRIYTSVKVAIFKLLIPATGAVTVTVTMSGAAATSNVTAINVWLATGIQSTAAVGTVSNTSTNVSGTINAAIAVGVGANTNGTAFTWSGMDEDYDQTISSRQFSAAHKLDPAGTVGASNANDSAVLIAGYT